jgi:hypothetical protein
MGKVQDGELQLQFVFQLDDPLPGLKASAEFAFVEGFNDKVICSTLDLLWTCESQHVKAASGPSTLIGLDSLLHCGKPYATFGVLSYGGECA